MGVYCTRQKGTIMDSQLLRIWLSEVLVFMVFESSPKYLNKYLNDVFVID